MGLGDPMLLGVGGTEDPLIGRRSSLVALAPNAASKLGVSALAQGVLHTWVCVLERGRGIDASRTPLVFLVNQVRDEIRQHSGRP